CPLLNDAQHRSHVSARKCCRIQPETGKDFTLVKSCGRERKAFVITAAEDEPVQFAVHYAPDKILQNIVSSIHAQLLVQVKGDRTGGNFPHPFGCANNVVIGAEFYLSATCRLKDET